MEVDVMDVQIWVEVRNEVVSNAQIRKEGVTHGGGEGFEGPGFGSRQSELVNTCRFPRKTFVDDRSEGSPWLTHVINVQLSDRFQFSSVTNFFNE
ncbi:hypothetical protein Tco_1096775 [Tanacetum coccineum]